MKIAIVVSRFNEEITSKMKSIAENRIKELKCQVVKAVEVPGAFEIPLAVKRFLENKKIDAVVTLGAIIKGGTDHDKLIAHAVAKKLLNLSCKYNKPVSLGVIGPNATWEQAEKRMEEYAVRAVDSVVEVLKNS